MPLLVPALRAAALAGLVLVAACGTAPRGTPSLASEQQRLSDLFRGTPVVFELQADGSLRAEVPLRHSFDRGASAVKPPLAAVLDRLATSQQAQATRWRIAAPSDTPPAGGPLAQDRAASVRDYLVSRGVAMQRFAGLGAMAADRVQVVVMPR